MIGSPGRSQRDTFGRTLADLATRNARIVVLDGDLANSTGAAIFADAHPGRFLQMGIAEQNMLGVAAGMSTLGWVPFISSFACFSVARAHDVIRVLIDQPSLNVKITGAYSGLLTGRTGKTHQMVDDIATMRAMPHMTVLVPGDEVETKGVIAFAAEHSGPMYIRLTRDPSPKLFPESHEFALSRNVLLRTGRDIGIVSTGVQSARALEAASLLADRGVNAAVLHVSTIKPLDEGSIIQLARTTGRLVSTEDHSVIGGLGSAVAETTAAAFPVPLLRHGLADTYGESGPDQALLEKYGLNPQSLAEGVVRFMQDT